MMCNMWVKWEKKSTREREKRPRQSEVSSKWRPKVNRHRDEPDCASSACRLMSRGWCRIVSILEGSLSACATRPGYGARTARYPATYREPVGRRWWVTSTKSPGSKLWRGPAIFRCCSWCCCHPFHHRHSSQVGRLILGCRGSISNGCGERRESGAGVSGCNKRTRETQGVNPRRREGEVVVRECWEIKGVGAGGAKEKMNKQKTKQEKKTHWVTVILLEY